jgi:hypothetical protein
MEIDMPRKINLNTIARRVVLREGGEVSLPIGQVKEVIRIYNEELSGYSDAAVLELMERTRATRADGEESNM